MPIRVSRLAPSPTGLLHLGNARTFLINWALARNNGWRLLMRIEDLDGPRVQPQAAERMLDTLHWLGLEHDGEPVHQSGDLRPYRDAMRRLASMELVYACDLTRGQVEKAASAPHSGDHELRFPHHLRPHDPSLHRFEREDRGYRLLVPNRSMVIEDEVGGSRSYRPCDEVGDFVVWTKHGFPSYQMAVVVDDARQGVTDVVRGDDLLPSAARQALLYEALGLPGPRWWHLPLVVGDDGMRLAKRHGDARLESFRAAGVSPERIIGLLARWSGVTRERCEMSALDFRQQFTLDKLDRRAITLTQEDLAWLLR